MFRHVCLSCLFAALVGLTSPVQKFPDWPTKPTVVVPTPMPAVKDEPVTVLLSGQLYVVQSDDPTQLLASPNGLVEIQEKPGPITIYGVFADGKGTPELRTYTGKQVFLVVRVAAGTFELLRVPKGEVQRRVLADSVEPTPPPKPIDPPKPGPTPVPAKEFRVFLVYESVGGKANITAEQQAILFGNVVEKYLDANCTKGKEGWRRRDKDSPAGGDMAGLWTAAKPQFTTFPCVVVQKDEDVKIIPFEATPEAMVAELEARRTGKK